MQRLALPGHDRHARLPQVVRLSDVHPDAVDLRAVQAQTFGHEFREQVFREVELLLGWDELQDLRFQDVDARVHEIRERLLGFRLLLEFRDPTVPVEADDPVLRRVRDFRQGDRHGGALALVEVVERLEVQIAQDVPHGDDEGFVEEISDPADRPRRAGGILFEAVQD